MWYVFDALEIIMGPYECEANAQSDFDLNVEEFYFLDDYPNAYIDFMEEDYFNIEDWEYEHYKWAEDSMLPIRGKKVKERKTWK